jgi:hypothetical protein
MDPLPHVLHRPAVPLRDDQLQRARISDLRRFAKLWLVPGVKLSDGECAAGVRRSMAEPRTAAAVVAALPHLDLPVLSAYRRYGGTVNGAVIRLDLLTRGVLEKVETSSRAYTWSRWKRDPLRHLAERGVLLWPSGEFVRSYHNSFGYSYGPETERAFLTLGLHAILAEPVKPLGPPEWTIPPLPGSPAGLGARSPAAVTLDLSRVFAHVASRGPLKLNKNGELATPALRTLVKAAPLGEEADFPLPDPQGLYFEMLRCLKLVRAEQGQAQADAVAAERFFALPTAWQAHEWTRAWMRLHYWGDGRGIGDDDYYDAQRYHHDGPLFTARQVLAWALSSLAHGRQGWFGLNDSLAKLHESVGGSSDHSLGWRDYAWGPKLDRPRNERLNGPDRLRASWFSGDGAWYANALMITLAALGFIERGRTSPGASADCFRLTPLGLTVFGAPELAPAEEKSGRFLVIQPNFDVLVYLDEADAGAVGGLGPLLESTSAAPGPVQTFRLTRNSLYQALESGRSHTEIVDALCRYSRHEPPVNVLRELAEWTARRESLVVRGSVTVVGFASTAARDTYLAANGGSAYGERFVLLPGQTKPKLPRSSEILKVDHAGPLRRTLGMDEQGHISAREPLDTVQWARLTRFTERSATGWQVTGVSVQRAAAGGGKATVLRRWLEEFTPRPLAPLLAHALDAWTGKTQPLEMASAVLLHIADTDVFEAVVASPRLRPFLHGSPGPNWLAVRKEAAGELSKILTRLGFSVCDELNYADLPGVQETTEY